MTSDDIRIDKANVIGLSVLALARAKQADKAGKLKAIHQELWALQALLSEQVRETTEAEQTRVDQLCDQAKLVDPTLKL